MQRQAHRLTNSRSYYEKENKQGGTNPPNQENEKSASQNATSQIASLDVKRAQRRRKCQNEIFNVACASIPVRERKVKSFFIIFSYAG